MGTRYAIHGLVSPGASVTVREDDGATLATIYAAQSGGSADADSKITAGATGRIVFYADSDDYSPLYRFSLLIELAGFDDIVVADVWSYFYAIHDINVGGAAAAVLDVCNDALVLIGEAKIASLSDENDRAVACSQLYPGVRDAVLRAYPWNCAMVYATLSVDATEPAWGYAYRYELPSSPYCLRLLGLDGSAYTYKVVGRFIYTNDVSDDLNVRYTSRLTDPADWDVLLRQAIVAKLARVLTIPLASDKKLMEMAEALYKGALMEARSVDGQEGSIDPIISDDFTSIR